jgi:peptidoglycan hydrolase CwlO-like protein
VAKSHKETNKMTEKMIKNLDEIENTQKILETLSAEQSDLSIKMAISADDADSASLIALAHRRNDLPIEILSTQIILERLYLQRDEARLPLLQAEVTKLTEPIEPMLKEIAEMQRKFNIASGAASNAIEDGRQLRMEISERKRSIEGLLHEARNSKIAPASLQAHGGI